jgi:phosphoribosylformylglycinamidine synthase
VLFAGMAGSQLPIVVAHGEGRAVFADPRGAGAALEQGLVMIRYVDHRGRATDAYPQNPNGSPLGITGLTNADGRVTILMPHPERCFLRRQYSWLPRDWPYEEVELTPFRGHFILWEGGVHENVRSERTRGAVRSTQSA